MRRLLLLTGILFGLLSPAAFAHEFWMLPITFTPMENTATRLQLYVGEHFDGAQAGFTTSHAAAMHHYSRKESLDLLGRLPEGRVLPDFTLPISEAGAHLIANNSHPALIELPADKFHDYLREEGLEKIIRQREENGTAASAGRERFRRHIKCLLQAGGKTDDAFAVRTGQRFEIVPLTNPHNKAAGDTRQQRYYCVRSARLPIRYLHSTRSRFTHSPAPDR